MTPTIAPTAAALSALNAASQSRGAGYYREMSWPEFIGHSLLWAVGMWATCIVVMWVIDRTFDEKRTLLRYTIDHLAFVASLARNIV